MANNLTQNPLIVVVAMPSSLLNSGGPTYISAIIKKAFSSGGANLNYTAAVSSRFIVTKVVWVNPTTNGDTYTVTDGQGVTIATGAAVTADLGMPQTNNCNREVGDVQVTQLSSGTLLIYMSQVGGN